ncbi:hypothetical protein Aduo_008728 [Ancylostoma duodenale]
MRSTCSMSARAFLGSDERYPRPSSDERMRGLSTKRRSQLEPVRSHELAISRSSRRVDLCCVQKTCWKGYKCAETDTDSCIMEQRIESKLV